jgi:Protein of unknown function (DUF3631)
MEVLPRIYLINVAVPLNGWYNALQVASMRLVTDATLATPTVGVTMKVETNVFDLVYDLIEQHVSAEPHYLVGATLWALHTHVYRKFDISPRLAILSPVEESGKSTILKVIRGIVWKPKYLIDPTPASIFRIASDVSLLLDEVDNVKIERQLRAIFNSGHMVGGQVPRVVLGETTYFPVFGPLALAGIGTLPPTLLSRSLIIHIHRSSTKPRFNKIEEAASIGAQVEEWAANVKLNLDPDVPLKGRAADNWRVLIAIADSLGRGDKAREAALKFTGEQTYPNLKLSLLYDIRTAFTEAEVTTLPGQRLVDKLVNMESSQADWSEHQLTTKKMASILNEFQIRNKLQRWPETGLERRVQRCYVRGDFEEMWKRYLTPGGVDVPHAPPASVTSVTSVTGIKRKLKRRE